MTPKRTISGAAGGAMMRALLRRCFPIAQVAFDAGERSPIVGRERRAARGLQLAQARVDFGDAGVHDADA